MKTKRLTDALSANTYQLVLLLSRSRLAPSQQSVTNNIYVHNGSGLLNSTRQHFFNMIGDMRTIDMQQVFLTDKDMGHENVFNSTGDIMKIKQQRYEIWPFL